MLKPLNQHCADLCTILEHADQFIWMNVIDWFHVAASVERVEVNTIQYDLGFGYCSGADEFAMSRETLLSEFVSRLSVFSFVWGGFEAALDNFRIPKHVERSKRGKIADACRYISRWYQTRFEISPYHEEVAEFRTALEKCDGYGKIGARFEAASDIGVAGMGLYAVYVFRNQFAHGCLRFPYPDGENRAISSHGDLVSHATRIVLLSLQMLLCIHYHSSGDKIEFSWNANFDGEEFDIYSLLRIFHFSRFDEEGEDQLALFTGRTYNNRLASKVVEC